MKTATGTTLFYNGQLLDGTGAAPIPNAAVVVTDGLITYAGPAADAPPTTDAREIDAQGGTIMPGLIEAHIHLTYFNVTELQDLDIKFPVEYVIPQPSDISVDIDEQNRLPTAARSIGPKRVANAGDS